jgi:hypothetical protein
MCCISAHILLTIDVDECKEKTACQCRNCQCQNTWGSYECSCGGNLLYMREHDTCISESSLLSFLFCMPYLVICMKCMSGLNIRHWFLWSYLTCRTLTQQDLEGHEGFRLLHDLHTPVVHTIN